MEIRSHLDFASGAKIKNLAQASANGEAIVYEQWSAAISGMSWKDNVRVASIANINLAAPGATIDGITMAANDRFLAKNQTSTLENGVYVWTGAATAATRATDANTADGLENAFVAVDEGTNALTVWRQSQANFTLDTDPILFSQFGAAAAAASETTSGVAEIATQGEADAGTDDLRIVTPLKLATSPWAAKRFSATFGDGTATQYDLTHNLNTTDILAAIKVVSTGSTVLCDWKAQSVNVIRINTVAAPAVNELRVTVSRG